MENFVAAAVVNGAADWQRSARSALCRKEKTMLHKIHSRIGI